MKILLIHTYYKLRGGEDVVFDQECALLQENNIVEVLTFENKGALQFLYSIWNVNVSKQVAQKIEQFKPDIVHIHNWHFASGPLIIRTAKRYKLPLIATLHNFRLLCPSAILMHNRQLFTDSLHKKFPWKAVRNKVYRNSFLQTFWLAVINYFHRLIGTWSKVDKFVVLTDFAKNIFVKSSINLPSEKFVIKPNFLDAEMSSPIKQKKDFIFIGRLSEEKGINYLLTAFENSQFNLYIGGDGPLSKMVDSASKKHSNINYLGSLTKHEVINWIREREILLLPSLCYEGMPMTIIEAFSQGVPVIASRLGALETIIQDGYNGLLFEPGNSEDLKAKLELWSSFTEEQKQEMSDNAYKTYLDNYTPEKNRAILIKIYNEVIG